MTAADDTSGEGVVEAPNAGWLTSGVRAVAAASFFSDSGHEVTTSVLPAFLTGTLGASAAALGVIDGISDALIGVMKLIGGPLANDPHWRARTASGTQLLTSQQRSVTTATSIAILIYAGHNVIATFASIGSGTVV